MTCLYALIMAIIFVASLPFVLILCDWWIDLAERTIEKIKRSLRKS